jgi:hypothetical protein
MFRPALSLRRLPSWTLMIAVAAALAGPAQAQWKWRDAKGQVHVSDIPPPREVPDRDVLQRPEAPTRRAPAAAPAVAASAPATAAKPTPPTDPELEERKSRAEQEQAAQRKAQDAKAAAARKDNCQRAREQVALLDSGQRIVRMAPNGEREYLTDEQRAQETQRARALIASECR